MFLCSRFLSKGLTYLPRSHVGRRYKAIVEHENNDGTLTVRFDKDGYECLGRPVVRPGPTVPRLGSCGGFHMGVLENSVPLNPMVNDHYPY